MNTSLVAAHTDMCETSSTMYMRHELWISHKLRIRVLLQRIPTCATNHQLCTCVTNYVYERVMKCELSIYIYIYIREIHMDSAMRHQLFICATNCGQVTNNIYQSCCSAYLHVRRDINYIHASTSHCPMYCSRNWIAEGKGKSQKKKEITHLTRPRPVRRRSSPCCVAEIE